jgi:hypothetical protein
LSANRNHLSLRSFSMHRMSASGAGHRSTTVNDSTTRKPYAAPSLDVLNLRETRDGEIDIEIGIGIGLGS